MPKLLTENRNQKSEHIHRVALRCFVRSGYNGVSIREIAAEGKLSLGNLYNYYPDKLALFQAALKSESANFLSPDNPVIAQLLKGKFPENLGQFGAAIGENVENYADYFKLMYVDLIEFEGVHIREIFSNLDVKFRKILAKRFSEIGHLGANQSIDPCFALIAVYMSFYQYFILTKLFGAKNVFGKLNDAQVIEGLSNMFQVGIART